MRLSEAARDNIRIWFSAPELWIALTVVVLSLAFRDNVTDLGVQLREAGIAVGFTLVAASGALVLGYRQQVQAIAENQEDAKLQEVLNQWPGYPKLRRRLRFAGVCVLAGLAGSVIGLV